MTPFLKLVADDLYGKVNGDFEDVTIIFPNKRATLFFNQYLWKNAGGRTMWTPQYTTISELFASLSDYTVADPIMLIVRLFEVYAQEMKPTKTLDQLYSLMETMLSDFQDIDNNLVEPSKLFLNIADLKELTDFSFLEDEQREAIEQFFGRFFDHVNPNTPLKTQFKTLWNHLTNIYNGFHAALLHPGDGTEPMVYEGMLKRMVVEALNGTDETLRRHTEARLTSGTYVMVGFNVLNRTELALFRYLKQNRDTKFYWDYDVAYAQRNASQFHLQGKYEAGQFINENIAQLSDELRGEPCFDNMRQPKRINFIQSPTENAQTRYVAEWMRTHLSPDEPLQESAVILCNENLLEPVLHSICPLPALNVTMGYPLTNTPIYSLVQVLLELQVRGRTRFGAWRYKQVAAVLKHAFIHKLVGQEGYEKLRELTKNNVVFPGVEAFGDNEVLRRIFTPVSGRGLTAYLADIVSLVGHSYQDAFDSQDFTLQIYKESIFVAYTTINRIRSLQEGHTALGVNDETLARIVLQLLRGAAIPFHGEPAVGLQVMGLLETRNLDFRHVVMLSVNEGQMPKSDKRVSLIPYTLRAAYGMTTIEREVSLYAYYYYRLLQRAESVTLLYNSSTDGGGKGEMSRFMLQTLAEKDDLFAPGQAIGLRSFTSANDTQPTSPFSVRKDEQVMAKLHARFNEENILSPSAIITYMKCPLKFYLNYVAGLRPDNDVSEDVDKPMFGTIFHYTMQKLYEPHVGRPFASTELKALANDKTHITQQVSNAIATQLFHLPEKDEDGHTIRYGTDRRLTLNGTQLINRHVIREFVVHQIEADAQMAERLEGEGGHLTVVSQEKQYVTQRYGLRLGGYIDRIDLLASPNGDRIRIVDYKTSNNAQTANTITDLFDPQKCTRNYHILQTLYYAEVVTSPGSEYADSTVCPALMYPAKDLSSNPSSIVKLMPPDSKKKEEIEDYKAQYGEAFSELLMRQIAEIFTPYQPESPQNGTFDQCEDEQNCSFCDFLTLCRRHPQKRF